MDGELFGGPYDGSRIDVGPRDRQWRVPISTQAYLDAEHPGIVSYHTAEYLWRGDVRNSTRLYLFTGYRTDEI